LVAGPRWAPDTKTDWPTDCRSKCDFDFDLIFQIVLSLELAFTCALVTGKVCKTERLLELLWVRYGDSSGNQKKGNVRR
jgi:hypothetical protein